jgi:(2Fe-2S) ferredoxin
MQPVRSSSVWYFQVQMEVTSWFVQDQLKGDSVTELRIKFIKRLEDAIPAGED